MRRWPENEGASRKLAGLLVVVIFAIVGTGVAAASVVSTPAVTVGGANVSAGATASVPITLDSVPNGLQKYELTIRLGNGTVADIEGASAGDIGGFQIVSEGDDTITVRGADFADDVQPGDGPVSLGAVTFEGTTPGGTRIDVTVAVMTNDDGEPIAPATTAGALTVTPGSSGDGGADESMASDATLTDGGTYWQGQVLRRSAGVAPNATLELYATDGETLVRELVASDQGVVRIATADLDGAYALRRPDGETIATFEVVPQELDVTWSDEAVLNQGAERVRLHIDSNRARFGIELTAPGLDPDELQAIFGGRETDDGVRLNVTGDATLTADFNGTPAGRYELTARVLDTGVSDTEPISVRTPGSVTAGFAEKTVREHRGDRVAITVMLESTDTAMVTIGAPAVNYIVELSVTDGDGNGRVTIEMDTFRAGGWSGATADAVFSTADSDDAVRATRVSEALAGPLEAGTYPVNVSVRGMEKAVGAVVLVAPSVDTPTVYTAPRNARFTDLAQLQQIATPDRTIAAGDWAIVEIPVAGVGTYFDGIEDIGTHGLSLSIRQTAPLMNRDPVVVPLSDVRAFFDPAHDRFLIAISTAPDAIRPGQVYTVTFGLDSRNPLVAPGANRTTNATFTIRPLSATVHHAAPDSLYLPRTATATISGSTTLAPGSTLTVTVDSHSKRDPLFIERSVSVRPNGTWALTLNTSRLANGTTLAVTITKSGQTLGTQSVTIGRRPTETSTPRVVTRTVIKTVTKPTVTERTVTRVVPVTRTVTVTVTRIVAVTRTVVVERTVMRTKSVVITSTTTPGFGLVLTGVALLLAGLLFARRR